MKFGAHMKFNTFIKMISIECPEEKIINEKNLVDLNVSFCFDLVSGRLSRSG